MNRGPASKVQTMPRSKREKKALAQIQNPSLDLNPSWAMQKQTRQRGREREREEES